MNASQSLRETQTVANPVASRLWIYTNFDCNLACTYCLTSSSPRAVRRALPIEAFRRLIDEAVAEGVGEVFLTGGEPFLLPDIFERIAYAAERRPLTILTNGMLLRGRRFEQLLELRRLAITLQVSLDGHVAGIHDSYRGAGSWSATVDAVRRLLDAQLRVTIGATETPANAAHIDALRDFVRALGIDERDFFLRPLTKRGFSQEGIDLLPAELAPELTVTAEGVFWHPQSAGEAMLLSRQIFPLSEAIELMQTNLDVMRAGGAVVRSYRCA